MKNIAGHYINNCNVPKAIEFFEKAATFLREKYGVTSLQVSSFLFSVSNDLYDIGQVSKSL